MCHSFHFTIVTIGFDSTTYSVREDAGGIVVSVSLMNGTVSQDVTVTLSIATDGTATGEANKIYVHLPHR